MQRLVGSGIALQRDRASGDGGNDFFWRCAPVIQLNADVSAPEKMVGPRRP